MRVVTIIPARKNSKGVPNKNIRDFCGAPLIVHSIKQAHASICNEVYVSTDSLEIKEIAESVGANVIIRPDELSGDLATSESALKHALVNIDGDIDVIVFLQCTSPIRRSSDIDGALTAFIDGDCDSLLSVVFAERHVWKGTGGVIDGSVNFDYKNRQRRQDRKEDDYWVENGSIYVFKKSTLDKYDNRLGGKIGLYEMPEFTQYEIDTLNDFDICELIYRKEICKNEQK